MSLYCITSVASVYSLLDIVQVCNNRGECSCDVGFTGANCETPFSGPGGGIHVYIHTWQLYKDAHLTQ